MSCIQSLLAAIINLLIILTGALLLSLDIIQVDDLPLCLRFDLHDGLPLDVLPAPALSQHHPQSELQILGDLPPPHCPDSNDRSDQENRGTMSL